jgi:hypothetical protein
MAKREAWVAAVGKRAKTNREEWMTFARENHGKLAVYALLGCIQEGLPTKVIFDEMPDPETMKRFAVFMLELGMYVYARRDVIVAYGDKQNQWMVLTPDVLDETKPVDCKFHIYSKNQIPIPDSEGCILM